MGTKKKKKELWLLTLYIPLIKLWLGRQLFRTICFAAQEKESSRNNAAFPRHYTCRCAWREACVLVRAGRDDLACDAPACVSRCELLALPAREASVPHCWASRQRE